MVWVRGGKCDEQTQSWDVATVERGRWHRVVLGAAWRADAKGFVKVWLDGEQRLNKQDISTTVVGVANRAFSFRVGLCASETRAARRGRRRFCRCGMMRLRLGVVRGRCSLGLGRV